MKLDAVQKASTPKRLLGLPEVSKQMRTSALSACSEVAAQATTKSAPASAMAALETKAWEVATTPLKSGGINYFMMWMGGSSQPGIFQILMMGYCLMGQLGLLRKVSLTFKPVECLAVNRQCSFLESPFKLQRVVYLMLCLGGLCYVGFTASKQGVLPFKTSDYMHLIPRKVLREAVGVTL
ncbi:MAG: hypothetical protein KVP17_000880 [Porospora cf. gigantea B]|uniref:uncharacterized protein n=1 Tax=Porospora cf. gigantea B TaxID=2853592 RepID=UPI003571827D|nr:MAG: hypothetical protein KVP17_000880 [Porospora cf. gigantea B]